MYWKTLTRAALALALAAPLAAQPGPRGMRGPGMQAPGGGEGIAHVLQLRQTLELTDDQVTRLESLQADFREQREAHREQAEAFRNRLRDGEVTPNEAREWRESRRESMENTRQAHREMVRQMLTEEQRVKLDEIGQFRRSGMRSGARAGFRAGRMMERRGPMGPGMRGNRGFRGRPGLRGPQGRGPGFFPPRARSSRGG